MTRSQIDPAQIKQKDAASGQALIWDQASQSWGPGDINLTLKADLASPSFTGTPTAPTPVTNDYSTRIATTEYVKNWWDTLGFPGGWTTVINSIGNDTDYKIETQRPRGLAFYCSGKPAASEVIASAVSSYSNSPSQTSLSAASSVVRAGVAATASTIFVIKRGTTQIGTITFGAGATVGVVTFTQTVINQNDLVTVTAPSTPDATLADITGLLSEAR